MTSTRPPLLAADRIRELTRTHTTTSVIHRDNGTKELHHITEPPLLDLTPAQLELAPSVVTEQFRALTLTEGA